LASAARGIAYLDQVRAQVIDGDSIDWRKYMNPQEYARIIPAEALAEKAKARMLLGVQNEHGLRLPWEKTKDKVLIRPGKVCVWAGWTHHGKTQMVKQLMLHGVTNSEKALIASMEEEVVDVWEDMAKTACGTQDPSPKQIDQFIGFIRGNLWLYDQQGMVDAKKMIAVIRYAAEELKVTQAVVDSLMMLSMSRDDYDAQADFVGELKAAAKDTGVTVHLVAHMRKREGKAGDEAIGTTHDIAGGHEIASKADYVFMPWRDKRPGALPACVLKVDKQRGRINWIGTVGLNYHAPSRQFVEDATPMKFWSDEPVDF
jgi:twinkle protein